MDDACSDPCHHELLCGVRCSPSQVAREMRRATTELSSRELEARSGFEISTARNDATVKVPDGVFLADGIDEDEAVVLSLWNDPDYQEALATLGFARADVIAAGLLANPALSVLFPAGSKQLEFTIGLPLELFFLRPKRLEAAKLDAERAVLVLVDAGLALIERVRLAWADGRLAHARAVDAEDLLEIAAEIAEHQAERLRAGDVSESEASLARVTALEEAQASERLRLEVEVAELRLRRFLGLDTPDGREVGLDFDEDFPPQGSEGAAADPSGKSMPEIDADELVRTAWSSRPDLRAAELALSSASERAGLSRWESLAVQAVLDANGDGGDSQFEIGPGLDAKVPIFDWNQAGMARADAEVERAALALAALRRRSPSMYARPFSAPISPLPKSRRSRTRFFHRFAAPSSKPGVHSKSVRRAAS